MPSPILQYTRYTFILFLFLFLIGSYSCNSKKHPKATSKPIYCNTELQQIENLMSLLQYKDTAIHRTPLLDTVLIFGTTHFKFITTEKGQRLSEIIITSDIKDSLALKGNINLGGFQYLKKIDIGNQLIDSLYLSDCPLLKNIRCTHSQLS